jgi:transcriptional regulator with XRE-family HTH domain
MRKQTHEIPEGGKRGRKSLPLAERRLIADRLRAWCRDRGLTRQAFAEKIGIPRTTVDGWSGSKPYSPEVVHLVKMADKARISPTFLLTGQGPDHLGSDRPLSELSVALLSYLKVEIGWQCSEGERADAVALMPTGQKLLDDFVEYYWTSVVAPGLNRMQLADALAIVGRIKRSQRWKPSGRPIVDAMTQPAPPSATELEKLTVIAERALGPRPYRTRAQRKLRKRGADTGNE